MKLVLHILGSILYLALFSKCRILKKTNSHTLSNRDDTTYMSQVKADPSSTPKSKSYTFLYMGQLKTIGGQSSSAGIKSTLSKMTVVTSTPYNAVSVCCWAFQTSSQTEIVSDYALQFKNSPSDFTPFLGGAIKADAAAQRTEIASNMQKNNVSLLITAFGNTYDPLKYKPINACTKLSNFVKENEYDGINMDIYNLNFEANRPQVLDWISKCLDVIIKILPRDQYVISISLPPEAYANTQSVGILNTKHAGNIDMLIIKYYASTATFSRLKSQESTTPTPATTTTTSTQTTGTKATSVQPSGKFNSCDSLFQSKAGQTFASLIDLKYDNSKLIIGKSFTKDQYYFDFGEMVKCLMPAAQKDLLARGFFFDDITKDSTGAQMLKFYDSNEAIYAMLKNQGKLKS